MLPFGVTIPATVPQRSEIPEGLMNKPVFLYCAYNVGLKAKICYNGCKFMSSENSTPYLISYIKISVKLYEVFRNALLA
jgi:hypothetical protein